MQPADKRILQIVPYMLGTHDGVGDYALTLARRLRADHGTDTVFVVAQSTAAPAFDQFSVYSGLQDAEALAAGCAGIVLHYVNYGFHPRGVPFALAKFVTSLRSHFRGCLITNFHELYASGAPWRSAFWLRAWQVAIARKLIALSNICFVSNETIRREIHRHDPRKVVQLLPIISPFGEPELDSIDTPSAHSWAICGGTALVSRSLRTLASKITRIPAWCAPRHLEVIGGRDDANVLLALRNLSSQAPNILIKRSPEVSADRASECLSTCSFGWIDYFGTGRVWPGMIFKSSSFAACCANALIPVFSHEETSLGVGQDLLPGPFFIAGKNMRLPAEHELKTVRDKTYWWYHRNASSTVVANAYAQALR